MKFGAISNPTNRCYSKQSNQNSFRVHEFVLIDAIKGDMGWTTSCERHKINMVRFSNRLMSLINTRLTKVMLNWDSKCRGKTWSLKIQSILMRQDHKM